MFHVTFGEEYNNENHLDVHFDYGLANQRCPEEGGERNEKVATSDTRQIKQRVRNLQTPIRSLISSAPYPH